MKKIMRNLEFEKKKKKRNHGFKNERSIAFLNSSLK